MLKINKVCFVDIFSAAQQPAPEVYTKPPSQPKEKKPGQLEPKLLEQYFDKGFLVIPKFFTMEEMQPAIEVRNAR